MSIDREAAIKDMTAQLSALVAQVESGKLSATDAVLKAYIVGHTDAMKEAEAAFDRVIKRLK